MSKSSVHKPRYLNGKSIDIYGSIVYFYIANLMCAIIQLFCDLITLILPDHTFIFFFFNDPATTEIYTFSLHDALPISRPISYRPITSRRRTRSPWPPRSAPRRSPNCCSPHWPGCPSGSVPSAPSISSASTRPHWPRSEEHTSELQSRLHLVCRLLLENK